MWIGAPSIALNPASPLARLLTGPVRPGVVRWIGVRPGRRLTMVGLEAVDISVADGLQGDHWHGRPGGNRQVTLMAREHLLAIASFLGASLTSCAMRRNLLVEGINLLALKGRCVRLGSALVEITGECHPCSRMEEVLGSGGYNAVRGHGGVTARVVSPGSIRVGDAVEVSQGFLREPP